MSESNLKEKSEETIDKKKLVDDICQAWFVSHNMGSDAEGRIHYRSKDGTLSKTVVPPDELRRKMEDPDVGIEAKARQLAPNLEFSLFWSPPDLREYASRQVSQDGEALNQPGGSAQAR